MIEAKVVADTNVVSYLFENDEQGLEYRYLIGGQRMGITLLSVEELYYGAARGKWGEPRRQALYSFLDAFVVLPAFDPVVYICANLRAERRRIGRPIELADAWVAATGLWFDIPVVTHDRDLER